jgi:hypothetical protein
MMSKTHAHHHETQSLPPRTWDHTLERSALDHAKRLIHRVCCLAGEPDLIDEIRTDNGAIRSAIMDHDTAALFDWLMAALSHQGISDRVADDYMDQHGRVTWHDIERALANSPSCPKLQSYWQFHGCRYQKASQTCAEPDHIAHCPLPTHTLRNGRLNQTAYSLYLFMRDIADNDLVGWIETQLTSAAASVDAYRIARMRHALVDPLRYVYGVSDKVLSMALSVLLMAAPKNMRLWAEVGVGMVAIDTLVHNFLVRTGILRRFNADHLYGPACYRPDGCADIIEWVANQIDARQFNPRFPKTSLGSCSTRFGGTVPRTGSTCVTATASTTTPAATTSIVKYVPCVIGGASHGRLCLGDRRFNHEKPSSRSKELLTTSVQRALQHLLKPIHLERLVQRRPVAIGLSQFAIARRKDERRAAGNEGIGNRRDGVAVEIGVEDRKIEVGVLRRFQRLVNARGFGGDGVAEFAEHVLEHHADHHLVFDDKDPLGLRRGLRFGCHPSPLHSNRHA